jgi:hypothetical protein
MKDINSLKKVKERRKEIILIKNVKGNLEN